MDHEPTDRQIEVLRIIADYHDAHKQSPTVREIAQVLRLSSTAAWFHIDALRVKGHIDDEVKGWRTYEVTQYGRAWLETHPEQKGNTDGEQG